MMYVEWHDDTIEKKDFKEGDHPLNKMNLKTHWQLKVDALV